MNNFSLLNMIEAFCIGFFLAYGMVNREWRKWLEQVTERK